jgi:trehalose 6-phosphate synthase
MAVTPLRDGMNLVAKEYVATRFDNTGALVLSEFAGAAAEFEHAFLVNPHDLDGLKRTLMRAIEADGPDLAHRMRAMRAHLSEHDIHAWLHKYLTALDTGGTLVAHLTR